MVSRALVAVSMLVTGAALLVAGAFGSVAHRTQPSVREGGIFRIDVPSFNTFEIDTALGYSQSSYSVAGLTCARLLSYPDKPPPAGYRFVPEVAAGYPTISGDGKSYTFTIRSGFRFSSGEKVTAASFARAMNRILAPRMRSGLAAFLDGVVGTTAVRAGRATTAAGIRARGSTLTIHLTRRIPDFTARMTLPAFCPVPRGLPVDPEGAGAPLAGSGPYYVAKFAHGREAVLRRNRFYRGGRSHHVDGYLFTIGELPPVIAARIERGETDWTPVVGMLTHDRLAEKYGVNRSQFFVQPGTVVDWVVLNTPGRSSGTTCRCGRP